MPTTEEIRRELLKVAEEEFTNWVRPHRELLRHEDIEMFSVPFKKAFCIGANWAVDKMMEKV